MRVDWVGLGAVEKTSAGVRDICLQGEGGSFLSSHALAARKGILLWHWPPGLKLHLSDQAVPPRSSPVWVGGEKFR